MASKTSSRGRSFRIVRSVVNPSTELVAVRASAVAAFLQITSAVSTSMTATIEFPTLIRQPGPRVVAFRKVAIVASKESTRG